MNWQALIARRRTWLQWTGTGLATWLAGCVAPPSPAPPPPAPRPERTPEPPQSAAPEPLTHVSHAQTPHDYRRDAANHLYQRNAERIYKGKMPPLLYAVGVLQVQLDRRGQVTATSWMRAPKHAPEVMVDIERTVHAAAPFPAPMRLGAVTYTETWLWHKSGRFQLHTLTEGQT